jgi:hypothetical protein
VADIRKKGAVPFSGRFHDWTGPRISARSRSKEEYVLPFVFRGWCAPPRSK